MRRSQAGRPYVDLLAGASCCGTIKVRTCGGSSGPVVGTVRLLLHKDGTPLVRAPVRVAARRRGTRDPVRVEVHGNDPMHAFQACSLNHSDISPSLESITYGHELKRKHGGLCKTP